MTEDEKLPLDIAVILKKLESYFSANSQNPLLQTIELNELIYALKADKETSIKTQEKAVESELKYEELQHSSLVGFLAFDTHLIIQTVNPTAYKILNKRKESIIGESFLDYVMPSYHRAFHSYIKKLLSTKIRQDHVLQLKRENSRDLYVILEGIPILDEKQEVILIRSIIIDITEQKLADLKTQSELIQAAVENMLDPFAILIAERDESDKITDFVYTYVNKAATEANKLSKEETLGRKLLEISPSLSGSEIFNDLVNVVENGEPVMKEGVYMEFTGEHQTINGIFQTRINKLADGIIMTFRDITEMKEAEEKLETAVTELEYSNKELEQFALIASHDLQEPLRMVTQYTRLLSERYKGKSDPKADEYISFIVDGTSRMLVLLKDLLKYARITSQEKPFEMTDMSKVMKEVLTDLKLLLEDHSVEINIDPLPCLMADPVQMRQLYQNLLGNAVKFNNSKTPILSISAKFLEKEWLFSVKDNGIGIEQKDFERIFMIFQRLNEEKKYAGSGLGLAICKKIVERHGGKIWVESEEDKGATFYFTIPADK